MNILCKQTMYLMDFAIYENNYEGLWLMQGFTDKSVMKLV